MRSAPSWACAPSAYRRSSLRNPRQPHVGVREIQRKAQRRAARKRPGDAERAIDDLEAPAAARTGQVRHDVLRANREQLAYQREPLAVRRDPAFGPVQLARLKGRQRIRIGNAFAHRRVGERGKAAEFLAPPARHGRGELGAEIAEELKRRGRGPFLAHEQHRHLRREE